MDVNLSKNVGPRKKVITLQKLQFFQQLRTGWQGVPISYLKIVTFQPYRIERSDESVYPLVMSDPTSNAFKSVSSETSQNFRIVPSRVSNQSSSRDRILQIENFSISEFYFFNGEEVIVIQNSLRCL